MLLCSATYFASLSVIIEQVRKTVGESVLMSDVS